MPPCDTLGTGGQVCEDCDADAVFHALSVAERRRLLDHLLREETLTVETVRDILGAELATTHHHLPLLEDVGLVEREGEAVSYQPCEVASVLVEALEE